jgi:hypothetical protein
MMLLFLLPAVFAVLCDMSDIDANTTVLNLVDCDPPSDLFDRFLFVKNFSLSPVGLICPQASSNSIRGVRPSRQLAYLRFFCVWGPVWSWIEASRDTLVGVNLRFFEDTDDTFERTLGDSLKALSLDVQLSANSIDTARLLRSATSLEFLFLNDVDLSGSLTFDFLTKLTSLGLWDLPSLPGPLRLPRSVQSVTLGRVDLMLPPLSTFTRLTSLDMWNCSVSGTLPPLPTSLQSLSIYAVLDGSLPPLQGLTNLTYLSVAAAGISGTLSPLPSSLAHLYLSNVPSLSGTLPALQGLMRLTHLEIGTAGFSGTLGPLPSSLIRLDLTDVPSLSGTLPALESLVYLTSLRISSTGVSGTLPKLPSLLTSIDLRDNALTFVASDSFLHLFRLQTLDLSRNGIESVLPKLPPTVVRADFSDNLFFGSIPPGFCGSGSLLLDLRLDRNKLSVSAAKLSNCTSLQFLSPLRTQTEVTPSPVPTTSLAPTTAPAPTPLPPPQTVSSRRLPPEIVWLILSGVVVLCGLSIICFTCHCVKKARSARRNAVKRLTLADLRIENRQAALSLAGGQDGMVEFVLEHGEDALDLDCCSADFLTPLSIAQRRSQVDATVALFSAGASALPMSQSCVTVSRPLVDGWPALDGATFGVVNGSLFAFCVDTTKKRPSVWQLDLQRMRTELIDEPIVWAEQGMRRGDDDDDASMSSADSMSSAASFSDDLDAIELGKVAPLKREPICARPGPRALVPDTEAPWISVGDDGLQLSCTAPRAWHIVVRSDLPLTPNATRNIGYFEVTIVDRGQLGDIYVGVSLPGGAKLKRLLSLSVARGCVRLNLTSERPFCAPLLAGDLVGVGVNFATRDVFFTRNGEFLGTAYRVPDDAVMLSNLRAGIGLRSVGECVRVNFGVSPFAFDFRADRLTWKPVATVSAGGRPLAGLVRWPMRVVMPLQGESAFMMLNAARAHYLRFQVVDDGVTWKCDRLALGIRMTAEYVSVRERAEAAHVGIFHVPVCEVSAFQHFVGLALLSIALGDGEVYVCGLELNAVNPALQYDGGWAILDVAADSPIEMPHVVSFSAILFGDFVVIVGGRRASLAVAKSAADLALTTETVEDAARDALFVFDLKRRHWIGIDQFVDVDEQWMRTVVEIGMSPSHVVTTFADGRVGALIYGGTHVYDNSPGGSTVCLFLEEHGQQLRVTFERPHAVGASLPATSSSALGSDRFVSVDLPQTGDCAWAWREPIVQLGRYDATLPSASLSKLLVDCSFADVKLVCGDGKSFDVHAPVCRARLSGLCVLLGGGGGKGGKAKRRVAAPANVSSQHMGWLLHYAYCDVMPSGAVSEEQIRAFLRECVVPLAPEHERRITELLVSARIKTPSRFASDMRAAFRVCDSAVDGDDDDDDDDDDLLSDVQLRLSDGRIVHAHRALLVAASGFFLTCFESELAPVGPVDMTGHDAALALAVVEFAYCGECAWDEVDVIELLLLARQLFVDALVDRCESLLIESVQQANEAWLREFAIAHGLARLADSL